MRGKYKLRKRCDGGGWQGAGSTLVAVIILMRFFFPNPVITTGQAMFNSLNKPLLSGTWITCVTGRVLHLAGDLVSL